LRFARLAGGALEDLAQLLRVERLGDVVGGTERIALTTVSDSSSAEHITTGALPPPAR
jgi:hypothetical protein